MYYLDAVFLFYVVVHVLILVAAALLVVDTMKHTKQLNKDIKKLRGSDNDRN